jgi:CBS domain containing-hemolysin-like protein
MVCVEQGTKLTKLINLIHSKGHTRIPLYNQTIDNVLGIIHAKELLPFIKNKNKKVDLVSLARPAMFVPESKHIDTLLSELQAAKQHMAIVVDEYGGTAGLITLEDVIEEIVGEIQDEYDEEKPLINKIDELHYLVDAKMDLAELNLELNLNLPDDKNYESLGGFIFDLIGSVPEKNQRIEFGRCTFIIKRVHKNRIVKVLIIKNQSDE